MPIPKRQNAAAVGGGGVAETAANEQDVPRDAPTPGKPTPGAGAAGGNVPVGDNADGTSRGESPLPAPVHTLRTLQADPSSPAPVSLPAEPAAAPVVESQVQKVRRLLEENRRVLSSSSSKNVLTSGDPASASMASKPPDFNAASVAEQARAARTALQEPRPEKVPDHEGPALEEVRTTAEAWKPLTSDPSDAILDGDGTMPSPEPAAAGAFPASWFHNDAADLASRSSDEATYEGLLVQDDTQSLDRSKLVSSPKNGNEPERNAEQENETKGRAATNLQSEPPLQGRSAAEEYMYDAVDFLA